MAKDQTILDVASNSDVAYLIYFSQYHKDFLVICVLEIYINVYSLLCSFILT